MSIVENIMTYNSKQLVEIYFPEKNIDKYEYRYLAESFYVGILAKDALNKEKNKNKPNFENAKLMDIFTHLVSEVFEIKYELNQDKINFKLVLEEIADCAALLTGLVAYIIEHKDK